MRFSIHRKLFLALKKVWTIKITPQVPLPGKLSLPVKFPIPPTTGGGIYSPPLHPLPLFGKPCYKYVYFVYIYCIYILPMYIMYVYYIFRLYRYNMYVCYGRVQINFWFSWHPLLEPFSYFTQWIRAICRLKIFLLFQKNYIQTYRPLHFGPENDASS